MLPIGGLYLSYMSAIKDNEQHTHKKRKKLCKREGNKWKRTAAHHQTIRRRWPYPVIKIIHIRRASLFHGCLTSKKEKNRKRRRKREKERTQITKQKGDRINFAVGEGCGKREGMEVRKVLFYSISNGQNWPLDVFWVTLMGARNGVYGRRPCSEILRPAVALRRTSCALLRTIPPLIHYSPCTRLQCSRRRLIYK